MKSSTHLPLFNLHTVFTPESQTTGKGPGKGPGPAHETTVKCFMFRDSHKINLRGREMIKTKISSVIRLILFSKNNGPYYLFESPTLTEHKSKV